MFYIFRMMLFGKKLFRPLHIKLKELREENSYISNTENDCSPSLHELAKYLNENHKPDHHILRDRAFCHDALLYWWNKEYDTMELFCTDGYWGSILDIWFNQKLYLRCVLLECEGYIKGCDVFYINVMGRCVHFH